MADKKPDNRKVVADNRRARFDYAIEDVIEAGIMLAGTEVKSLRNGRATIGDSYASPEDGGLWLVNSYIPELNSVGAFFQHDPKRRRKLLLHRKEIVKLTNAVNREGMTIVPLKMYFNEKGRAKIEIAVAKGKKLHDKRDTEKKRDWTREKGRLMRDKG